MSTAFEKIIWQSGSNYVKISGTIDYGTFTFHFIHNNPDHVVAAWGKRRTIEYKNYVLTKDNTYNFDGIYGAISDDESKITGHLDSSFIGRYDFINCQDIVTHDDHAGSKDSYYWNTIIWDYTYGETKDYTFSGNVAYIRIWLLPKSSYGSEPLFDIVTTVPLININSFSISGNEFGSNITITPSPLTPDCSYKYTLSIGEHSYVETITGESLTYLLPIEWADSVIYSDSGELEISIDLFYDNITCSKLSGKANVSVPASCVPVVNSATIIDYLNKVPADWNMFLQYVSAFKISTISIAESYGSAVNKIDFSVGSLSASGTKEALPQLTAQQESGNLTATITLTDTRGRTGVYTTQLTVATYSPPSFNNVSSYRSKQDGTKDSNGLYGLAESSINFTSLDEKNSATLKVSYKKSSESTYGTDVAITVGSSVFGGDFSLDDAYDVKYTLSDLITSVVYLDYISSASYLISLRKGGDGIAFGIKSETANLIEMGFNTKFDHAVTFTTSKGNEVTIQQIIDALNLDA